MKVILVALATVVPFGFFIIAVILACRHALGLPTGPAMLGMSEPDWQSVATGLARRARGLLPPRLQCGTR